MSFGKMRSIIEIAERVSEKDADGFAKSAYSVLKTVRAYREDRRGSETWANRSAFSNADVMFRLRKIPDLEITPKHFIICGGRNYNISSAEDVKQRGMYIEILCDSTEGSMK